MLNTRFLIITYIALTILISPVLADGHHHHPEVFISVSDGNLVIDHKPHHIDLNYDIDTGHYISNSICWESIAPLTATEPQQPSWRIELEKITFDSGLYAVNDNFQQILDNENFVIGEPVWNESEGWHFHTHSIFGVANATIGDEFTAILRLVDGSGVYGNSEQFELNFSVVPEPVTIAYLVGGTLLALKRKNKTLKA